MSGRKPAQEKKEQLSLGPKKAAAQLCHELTVADRLFVKATNGTGRRLATTVALMAILKFLDSPKVSFPTRAVSHLFETLADVSHGRIGDILQPAPMPVGRKTDTAETQVLKAAIAAAVDLLSEGGKGAGNLTRIGAAQEISKWLAGRGARQKRKRYSEKHILNIAREFSRPRPRAVPEARSRRAFSGNPNELYHLSRELHRLIGIRFYEAFRKRHRDLLEQDPRNNALPARKAWARLLVQSALAALASPEGASPKA